MLPEDGRSHPLAKKMKMVGVVLSGQLCMVEDFHKELQTLSLNHGGKEPTNSIHWHGNDGIFGVCKNMKIPFKRLKLI